MSGEFDKPPKYPIPKGPLLSDLAGMDEARAHAEGLIADIRLYRAGKIPWSDIDAGIVVHGPPGTGKTTFGRAVAASAGLPFIQTSYADWGRGSIYASAVVDSIQDIFKEAAAIAPCLVLIDEFDSIPARDMLDGNQVGSHTIVNAMLTEFDNLKGKEGIIVVVTCNHVNRLDAALVRPGRLGKTIRIGLPSRREIPKILAFHLKTDAARMGDLFPAALMCAGMSGAAVEQVVREARQRARRANRPIARQDLMDILEARARTLSPDAQRVVAVHEAGHAVAALRLFNPTDLAITTIPSGDRNGKTAFTYLDGVITDTDISRQLVVYLAGMAAERFVLGRCSDSAGGNEHSDLARATDLAIRAVSQLGFSSERLFWYRKGSFVPGDLMAEAQQRITEASKSADALILQERGFVREVARKLVTCRAMTLDDIRACDRFSLNASRKPPLAALPPPAWTAPLPQGQGATTAPSALDAAPWHSDDARSVPEDLQRPSYAPDRQWPPPPLPASRPSQFASSPSRHDHRGAPPGYEATVTPDFPRQFDRYPEPLRGGQHRPVSLGSHRPAATPAFPAQPYARFPAGDSETRLHRPSNNRSNAADAKDDSLIGKLRDAVRRLWS